MARAAASGWAAPMKRRTGLALPFWLQVSKMADNLWINSQVPERGTQVHIATAHHAMRGEAANVFMSGLPVGRHV